MGAVDLIVQVGRNRDGVRRIMQVTDVAGVENGMVVMNDLFRLGFDGEDSNGRLLSHYDVSNIRPSFMKNSNITRWMVSGTPLWRITAHDGASRPVARHGGCGRVGGRGLVGVCRLPAYACSGTAE
ncbi:hypothetical protein [Acetobacter papayae]|uniref:hypothetical protein n=1 Tax=Acetobacter papayae TaxID=1076592 RepID=UPI001F2DBDF1|nr:hypothetical protein [Acetobacter papayae]